MAQIYVNSGLVKPKSIHVYNSTAQLWTGKKVGYIRINGEWIPFIKYEEYLYNRGQEILIFDRTNMAGTFTKEVDHYVLEVMSTSRSVTVPVLSNVPVDLTNFNKLSFIHEPKNFYGSSHLTLFTSLSRTHTHPIVQSQVSFSDMELNELNVIEVDVSSLSGLYYIGFILQAPTGENIGATSVYQIFLE